MQFDEYQQIYIDYKLPKNSSLSVSATAGSGKSTTTTYKIGTLIESGQFKSNEIVFLTFSNKSARDIQLKYRKMVNIKPLPYIGTIHSFCIHILKDFMKKKPNILNEWSSMLVLRKVLEKNNIPEKYNIENKKQLNQLCFQLLDLFNWYKSNLVGAVPVSCDFDIFDTEEGQECPVQKEVFVFLFQEYEKIKSILNQYDYSDILHKVYTAVQSNPTLLQSIKEKYPLFIVDEAQDNDPLIFHLIYTLSSGNNLIMIFDRMQTIYKFRWAAPEFISESHIKKYFDSYKELNLLYNYRSTENIVRVSNMIRSQKKATLALATKPSVKGSVKYLKARDNIAEGTVIANEIKTLIESGGYSYKDITIIARKNSFLKTVVEPALSKEKIPYALVIKNAIKFYEKSTIQTYFNLVSYYINPENVISLLAIVQNISGVGDKFLDKLRDDLMMGTPIDDLNYIKSDYTKLSKIFRFRTDFNECRIQQADQISTLLNHWRHLTKLYFNEGFCSEKEENIIHKTILSWVYYFIEEGVTDIDEILTLILLDFNNIIDNEDANEVKLSSVHATKGLEYPVVFVAGNSSAKQMRDLGDEAQILFVQLSRAIEKMTIISSDTYINHKLESNKAVKTQPFMKFEKELTGN